MKATTSNTQYKRPIKGMVYEFESRWDNITLAQAAAFCISMEVGVKHAYYTKITVKGATFFDVRVCK